MKGNRGYAPETSIFPFAGLDTLVPSTQLDPRFSPRLQNIEIQKGILSKRRGYQLQGAALNGVIIGLVEFETLSGTKVLLALTTTKQYRWDGSTWVNITYQVAAADVNWTGTELDWLDYGFVAGLDSAGVAKKWIIITNGKDTPRYWDGTMAKFARYHGDTVANGGAALNYGSFVTARTISQFYNHVVMGNITTGAQAKNLISWSDTGDLTDFVGTNSGDQLIPDIRGEILRLIPLGDRLIIYGENSTHSLAFVAGALIFNYDNILQETRLVSGRSIVNIGPFHIMLTEENVVLFDGTKYFRPLGDRIYREYRDNLYVSGRKKAFAFHDPARQHVYFNVPTGATTSMFYRMQYDLGDLANSQWTKMQYTHRPASMGLFSRDTALTWDALKAKGLSWDELNFPWNRGTLKNSFPIRVFGDGTGQVYTDDEIVAKDGSTPIQSYYDTPDFSVPGSFRSALGRWLEIEIDLRGYECDIYTSHDEGRTYAFAKKLELTSQWTKYKIPIDVLGMHLRVRLENFCANSNFECRFLRVWLNESGPSDG